MIDNYDSFTYNLVHLFEELGAEVVTVPKRRDHGRRGARRLAPDRLVVSPGPGRPEDAGVSIELIRALGPTVPTLGVCLGHQAIVEAFGGDGRPGEGAPARQVEHDRARRPRRLRGPARRRRGRALPLARGRRRCPTSSRSRRAPPTAR